MPACVLVVEDERKIRELLRSYLEHEGLSVVTTGSGAEAIQLARSARPDLILLDLGLPDVPGEEVVREVREFSTAPVIMLTARTEVDDRIRGLRLGADDYVTKPFSPREVALRVLAVLRRTGAEGPRPISFGRGRLVIDETARTVVVEGHPAPLTRSEWDLLSALTGAPGRVFSRSELVNRIRGYEFDGYERIIDTHVKNLRRKLQPPGPGPGPGEGDGGQGGEQGAGVIETVIGAGYRLGLRRDQLAD